MQGETQVTGDEKPCRHCGSPRHGSRAHHRLTMQQGIWQPWAIGWVHSRGMPGVPSPSGGFQTPPPIGEHILVPPDLVAIVPSIIGVGSWTDSPVMTQAILRLWNPDPAGGLTFMLSYDSPAFSMSELSKLERQFSELGSRGTVAVRFASMSPTEALDITSQSTL